MPVLELGNHSRLRPSPGTEHAPAVTTVSIPTGDGGLTLEHGLDVDDFRRHLADSLLFDRPTRRPDHEAALVIPHLWSKHASSLPTWVASDGSPDGDELTRITSDFYQIPVGYPDLYQDMYYRQVGNRLLMPGVTYGAATDLTGMLTNVGRSIWANALGGGAVGAVGAGSAATSTTLTTASTFTTNQWAGKRVYAYSTTGALIVWGNIVSNNNAASASVLTVDRWYNAATPGGAAATTPTTPWSFLIADGGSISAWFVGISATNITPAVTDTSLSGEQTTNGLGRMLAPYAITSATSPVSYTLTPVWTYTGATSSTIYAMAAFVSMVVSDATDSMVFETSLNASATVTASGDQITITETVSGS